VFERKNPLGLITAFTEAFAPGTGAALLIKTINADQHPSEHDLLLADAARHPDIRVQEGYLDPRVKNALLASCDCYVSLHRAEGFGLTLAEAIYFGCPVIGTGYSGNLDFMSEENSCLVDFELIPIGRGAGPYPAEGEWAEPDLDHAARLMREAFDDPARSREIGARGAADIRRTHSREAAGSVMRRRLEAIRASSLLP
jgi:glycosyltransferase involved in cell wall biosynthesis